MSDYIFIFDLDSTITKEEILPKIADLVGKKDEMVQLTEDAMQGVVPYKESLLKRINLLSDISISYVQKEISKVLLNDKLVEFIKQNKERCYVVTANLDIWIESLMKELNMLDHCFSSKALKYEDKLINVVSIVDKRRVIEQFINKLVVIGDGNNDAEMIDLADIGIGFGGVRRIAPSVLETCNFAIYDEETLVKLLNKLL